ncbi:ADAMTS-like protein 4 isoform X1 [Maniola hyperantus]|uniref:ADAMTS-like protein 4 isoform X1 n=1 Tax=Aphantopus hyperantus TaxID=2795564 RepID=UPI002141C235
MERRKHFIWRKQPFWLVVVMQLAMFTTATNVTTDSSQVIEDSSAKLYVWSSWGSWSPCSRTCGGGVSVQERQCLPRSRNPAVVPNTTLDTPTIRVRVTRQTSQDCLGISKRYHECNTAPCLTGEKDMRAEQCSSYDRRPFRGRFYTWVPYVDGNSPCLLNCRPLGQQFYASLSLVADGSPCTKPGYRAMCVQGSCKVVGRDVLAVTGGRDRDVRCGRRLVSGLFARPRLPLGYSYVTTVPTGACRLNVSEIVSSDNYIALKISNGSYIMNGEFAVSSPGTYEAAGTRFIYTRNIGLDSVFALGPIQYPIDIMVLYTQPNPSIRYEYFTESIPGQVDVESVTYPNLQEPTVLPKHTRRHHGFDAYPRSGIRHPDSAGLGKDSSIENSFEENIVGERKFIWKILSYTQCSRSCGGGIQVGKYRCVEANSMGDREVSSVHCSGSPPAGKRRRCGQGPCAPRWRAAAWSPCPQCGPATRTRIVGCVQDHSRGITKVSDQKCPAPKPTTTETCKIPDCGLTPGIRQVERSKPRLQTDTFRDGPVYTIAVNSSDTELGPEYSFNTGVGGWLQTDWSECVGWCVGGGLQTRAVRCADPSGCPRNSPEQSRTCSPRLTCDAHSGHWFTGDWSPCTSSCGGKQIRGVLCIGGTGRHLRDSACKEPKPEHERNCGGECPPIWYTSEWGQCTGNCTLEVGVQRRTVVCARGDNAAASDIECPSPRPHAHRPCEPKCAEATLPPQLAIESQKAVTETPTTQRSITTISIKKDCEDKLPNCALAVQARLCHYKYYIQNCCDSCNVP